MKKGTKLILSGLATSFVPLSAITLIQCSNKEENEIKEIQEKIKSLDKENPNIIDSALYSYAKAVIESSPKEFLSQRSKFYIKNLLSLLEFTKNSPVLLDKLPEGLEKSEEKLRVIYDLFSFIVNMEGFLEKSEVHKITPDFLDIREVLTKKRVFSIEEFDNVVKRFIVLNKKVRSLINKKIPNWDNWKIAILKLKYGFLFNPDNTINNEDLDNIYKIEPSPEPQPNPQPEPQPEDNNKEIKISNEFIVVNGKEYHFSNRFQEGLVTEVRLIDVNDGDTAKFNSISSNETNKFRFSGIDTPETWFKDKNGDFQPTTGKQYKYGTIAKKFTISNLEEAKRIWVIPQTTISEKNTDEGRFFFDPYGRIVAIIIIEKQNGELICLNNELIKNGHSKVAYITLDSKNKYYTKNENYYHWIKKSERQARENKIGIWGDNIKEIYPPKGKR
ncbi:thermonuclease family protein [Mycoplasmopsis arginini]|uniref:thermonuclease family protein n=1 Tax=Mycoplasmopsis arginini TaxID=2094 RepID=UPI003CFBD664